jgi:hypothetical protein
VALIGPGLVGWQLGRFVVCHAIFVWVVTGLGRSQVGLEAGGRVIASGRVGVGQARLKVCEGLGSCGALPLGLTGEKRVHLHSHTADTVAKIADNSAIVGVLSGNELAGLGLGMLNGVSSVVEQLLSLLAGERG